MSNNKPNPKDFTQKTCKFLYLYYKNEKEASVEANLDFLSVVNWDEKTQSRIDFDKLNINQLKQHFITNGDNIDDYRHRLALEPTVWPISLPHPRDDRS